MHPMLNTAVKAARKAGAIINRAANDLDRLTVHAKKPRDYVSEVDRFAEETIILPGNRAPKASWGGQQGR